MIRASSHIHIPRVLAVALVASIVSCVNLGTQTYDQAEPTGLPDTVTYTTDIKPIIDTKCCNCHSRPPGRTAEGLDYSTYDQVIPATPQGSDEARSGWQGIKQAGIQDMTMPPGGKERFTPREVALLLKWESQGFVKQ
jgi:uncharacterized membrane protein